MKQHKQTWKEEQKKSKTQTNRNKKQTTKFASRDVARNLERNKKTKNKDLVQQNPILVFANANKNTEKKKQNENCKSTKCAYACWCNVYCKGAKDSKANACIFSFTNYFSYVLLEYLLYLFFILLQKKEVIIILILTNKKLKHMKQNYHTLARK